MPTLTCRRRKGEGGFLKASDWIAEFLKQKVEYVFGLQGGAVVHLFDSCERIGPKPIYCHHEQAAAFSASGYARVHGYGVCIATTGPGAVNALTGCLGAWQDSIPMMFISGQARADQTSYGKRVRQVGTQEFPITTVASQMTNSAIFIADAGAIKEAFEFSYRKSVSGRPGPCWIDLPVDLQWGEI